MEPALQKKTQTTKHKRPETRYLWSFAWMILFTAFAFYIVAYPLFSWTTTFWLIVAAAAIQVFLQLFTFMHLDEKGQTIPVIFMLLGLFIAVISIVGIVLL
jgi:cytochrome c oxidase subunit 4